MSQPGPGGVPQLVQVPIVVVVIPGWPSEAPEDEVKLLHRPRPNVAVPSVPVPVRAMRLVPHAVLLVVIGDGWPVSVTLNDASSVPSTRSAQLSAIWVLLTIT